MGTLFSLPRVLFQPRVEVVPLGKEREKSIVIPVSFQRNESWLCPTCNWRYPGTTLECLGAKCRQKQKQELV